MRMGRDKALLELRGRPLIAYSLDALHGVADDVVIAPGVEGRYLELGLPLVLDVVPDGGPLSGLCAVLESARTPWVAVLACDMPRASSEVLEHLAERALEGGHDACMLRTEAGLEPLCAVYHVRCAPFVRAALEAGERKLLSFRAIEIAGRRLSVAELDERELAPQRRGAACNVNTPADYHAESAS